MRTLMWTWADGDEIQWWDLLEVQGWLCSCPGWQVGTHPGARWLGGQKGSGKPEGRGLQEWPGLGSQGPKPWGALLSPPSGRGPNAWASKGLSQTRTGPQVHQALNVRDVFGLHQQQVSWYRGAWKSSEAEKQPFLISWPPLLNIHRVHSEFDFYQNKLNYKKYKNLVFIYSYTDLHVTVVNTL